MGEPAPGETLDQYELLDVIARSGMATIFRARDRENGHTVALKVPHLEYASDLVFHRRFQREEAIGQRLAHARRAASTSPWSTSRVSSCASGCAARAACRSLTRSSWGSRSPTRWSTS